MAGETLFLIQGDKPQSLNWTEYGFRLHFPQGTISPSDTCEVVVKALVGGKFQFPEGTELVSAVYAVAFAKKLLKAVEMEIQHCVILTNEEQGKRLSFVSTAKTHRHHPNKFEFVKVECSLLVKDMPVSNECTIAKMQLQKTHHQEMMNL